MIKAIIFDFNGVIVDDEPLHEKAFRQACLEIGIRLSSQDYAVFCLGRTDMDGARRIQEKFSLSDKSREDLLQRKSKLYFVLLKSNLHTVLGVIELIGMLKGSFLLAIATAAYPEEVEFILQALGIREDFGVIVSAKDVTHSKPHPEPYLLAAKKLGVLPSECAVIEDTPSGIISAKGAGMKCIAITTTRRKEELQQADVTVDGLFEISADLINKFVFRFAQNKPL